MPVIQPPGNFSGLASNLDTSGIVDRLMQIERMPEQKLDDEIKQVQQKKAAWLGINSTLLNLNTAAEGLTDSTLWSALGATVTDQTALTATAGSGAVAGTFNLTVDRLAVAESVISSDFDSETTALNLTGTFNITVAGTTKSIAVAAADTLNSLRGKINQAGAGVSASVVSKTPGSFALLVAANGTGTANAITLTDDAAHHTLQSLGLLTGGGAKNVVQAAQDAQFTVNGLTFTRPTNTVSDAIKGVTLNLQGLNTTGLTLTVQTDTATMAGRIQDFVSKYNAAHAAISKQTAQGALLQGDSGLNGIGYQLSSLSYSTVAGLSGLNNLSQIGITLQRDGSLSVDSAKLTAALSSRLSDVQALFATDKTGLAVQFSTYLNGLTRANGTLDGMNQSFDRQVQDLRGQRQRMEVALTTREQTLKAEFLQMEQAVSQFQAQGNWLSSQLRGLTGGSSSGP